MIGLCKKNCIFNNNTLENICLYGERCNVEICKLCCQEERCKIINKFCFVGTYKNGEEGIVYFWKEVSRDGTAARGDVLRSLISDKLC